MRIKITNKTVLKAILYDYLTHDGGAGSGNFGHSGRPGQIGGSGAGGLTKVTSGDVKSKGYSLTSSKVGRSKGADRVFTSTGKPRKGFPKGTGRTVLNESDLKNGVHSCIKHIGEDGHLTPEREKLHEELATQFFKGKKPVPPGEKKTFFVLGGGPASGKGSLTDPQTHEKFGVPSKDEQATIDADEIKKGIPEYGIKNRDAAAAFAHEESSAITKRAMQAGFDNGYNVTLDGTGDGSLSSMKKKIKAARDAGYSVEGAYVTCPVEESIKREKWRSTHPKPGEMGRHVPEKQLRKIHREVSKIFPQIAPEFDHVKLFDTSGPKGSEPKLIAECYKGGPIIVHDKKLYQNFLDKGK